MTRAKTDSGVHSLATLGPRPEIIPSMQPIDAVSRRIDEANSIVIMCGGGCESAAQELRALSDRLKASTPGTDNSPSFLQF
jgi:pyruvate dehydrogenase (quinone)